LVADADESKTVDRIYTSLGRLREHRVGDTVIADATSCHHSDKSPTPNTVSVCYYYYLMCLLGCTPLGAEEERLGRVRNGSRDRQDVIWVGQRSSHQPDSRVHSAGLPPNSVENR